MFMKGKVAVVTGAAGGIGRSVCHRLAAEGGTMALCDLDAEKLEVTLQSLGHAEPAHRAFRVDLTNPSEIQAFVRDVLQSLGRVDVLINNAGIVQRRNLFEIAESDWDLMYAVNVKAPFLLTQAVARHMVARGGGGKIVNVASIAGRVARGDKAHYASSKAALIHFSRCAAMELGPHGISVNVICPGPTDTDMIAHPVTEEYIHKHGIPLGRIARPEDQADAIAFLASPQADQITGQVLNVDGGEVMV
jgi:NAD(P)-dependent dehydrogenase (short-subunit alcohol dehydrogenase family)